MHDYVEVTPCLRCRRLTANLGKICVRCLGYVDPSRNEPPHYSNQEEPTHYRYNNGSRRQAGGGNQIFRKSVDRPT